MALALALLATLVALGGAAIGLAVSSARETTHAIVPFSGGILLGVAVFDLLPELIRGIGWTWVLPLFAIGFGLLSLVDRLERADLSRGFAVPLLVAASVHAFVDGWGIASAAQSAAVGVRVGLPIAVLLHKLPEGVSLGGLLRASEKSQWKAFGWCFAAESATMVGGVVGLAMTPRFGTVWVSYPLAVAGGCFVYLGLHAVHAEWKQRGAAPACLAALAGVIGAVVIEHGARVLLP